MEPTTKKNTKKETPPTPNVMKSVVLAHGFANLFHSDAIIKLIN